MNPTVKILQPCGILDNVTTNQLYRDIHNIVEDGVEIILVDFQGIILMNSSGIGALVSTLQIVKVAGVKLFICSLNEQVKMILELTKIDRFLKIFANREEFEQQFLPSVN
ncbi:MAG: STAS domain-containing protein [Symploca sp. SIO2E9]|nr:STAS domain-containing protein [Symploca sp. SIO2E9]